MIHAISTYVYVERRLTPELLDRLVRAGAEAIEIFCARQHFDYRDPHQLKEVAAWFASSGVPLHSLHSPLYTDEAWGEAGGHAVEIDALNDDTRSRSVDEALRALAVAEQIPFKFLVQHIGMAGDPLVQGQLQRAVDSMQRIASAAASAGAQLLLENIPNEISAPAVLLQFMESVHGLAICFDVGHAHMANGVQASFAALKEHIRSTHVHDNFGDRDSHKWPEAGDVDWASAMRLLRSAPQSPPLLLEINGDAYQNEDQADVEQHLKDAFLFLERL